LSEYERQGREEMRKVLGRPGPARQTIREWIEAAGRHCSGGAGQKGCLALKAAMEMAPQDADVANWVRRMTHAREQLIASVIKRGQAEGEINSKLEPRAAARYLLGALAGLGVMGVTAPPERKVREVVGLILRVLD
jgi:TetR/AcrR family transcriptional repressor of nem operon